MADLLLEYIIPGDGSLVLRRLDSGRHPYATHRTNPETGKYVLGQYFATYEEGKANWEERRAPHMREGRS
jgi:hypothetical protein